MQGSAFAAAEQSPLVSVRYENDAFANQDGGYTSGMQFTVIPASTAPDPVLAVATALSPLSSSDGALPWSVTVSQFMFTPRDISEPEFPPQDRPYAGWLNASLSVFSLTAGRLERFRLGAGVVGPSSGAEQVQKQVHEMIGANAPIGWDNQVPDEVTLQLSYDTQWRLPFYSGALEWELLPGAGITAGNALTGAEAGVLVRAGRNVPLDFGPPRLRSLAGGSAYHGVTTGLGWFAYGGVAYQYINHDITIDGSLFTDEGPYVSRKDSRRQYYAGAAVFAGDVRVSLTTVLESKAFAAQNGNTRYGGFSVSWRW